MTALPEEYTLEEAPAILTPPSRALIDVVTFKAFYTDLRKARYGDYSLVLGVPFDQKDLAWELSNYDGRMMEVRFKTMAKLSGK